MKFNNETLKEAVKEWRKDLKNAKNKYGHITDWDTSEVTDMSGLFQNYRGFNQNIGKWVTSNVSNMDGMFYNAKKFNQDISGWDVSKVETMKYMFEDAISFNQNIGSWDVSNVTDCKLFDQNTHNWTFEKPNFVNCKVKL